ncbi:hypothetical protein [Agaribacterium haliotis]|uniref:hypothetical protein n=1 Tax=Agaribacterium haliotis TaxID=2013869 RepID=UPI000BB59EB2|nr:hypothetical protein [Agaribacterium haliotis]
MKINTSVGKASTSLRWDIAGEKVKFKVSGRACAEYSETRNVIVVAAIDGMLRILKPEDASLISQFPCNEADKQNFYLLEKSRARDLGVRIIMAHTPELKCERFWQHDIDLENMKISEPKAKWR